MKKYLCACACGHVQVRVRTCLKNTYPYICLSKKLFDAFYFNDLYLLNLWNKIYKHIMQENLMSILSKKYNL